MLNNTAGKFIGVLELWEMPLCRTPQKVASKALLP